MGDYERQVAELLFGNPRRTDLYADFRRGRDAPHDTAQRVLEALAHPELVRANLSLKRQMDISSPNAVYAGDEASYARANGSDFSLLLFRPELRADIYEPFVGLTASANSSYRFQTGSQDFRIVFNNLSDGDQTTGGNIQHRSMHAVRSNVRSR